MFTSIWLFWMIFMFMFFMLPVGYGAGYRRWGAPYPRYFQRRRTQQVTVAGSAVAVNTESWGLGGDFVWGVLLIGTVWALAALFWR